MKAIILAGGGGTRLWPLSRKNKPKQFQKIIGSETLIEQTYRRLKHALSEKDIYFSVTENTVRSVRRIFNGIPKSRLIVEPEKRDTGPAMGYVAAHFDLTDKNEPIAFIPADHYIKDYRSFKKTLKVAESLIKKKGCLVDIGVKPYWPNDNLGYTKVGRKLQMIKGIEVYEYKGHVEKPTRQKAKGYIASGNYLWHANYYMWTPSAFLKAYRKYMPKTYKALKEIQLFIPAQDKRSIASIYKKLEKISIDYGITEKLNPRQVLILKAPFDWSDVGLWGVIKKIQEKGKNDNVIKARGLISIDTKNSVLYSSDNKLIAAIGIKDLVVVDTDDAILICKKERDQEVKKVVEMIKKNKLEKYL